MLPSRQSNQCAGGSLNTDAIIDSSSMLLA
jgi:hypothetical protein